jgi:hypothetical protein
MVSFGNPLISLRRAVSALQHETDGKNEVETARNPLFAGLNAGALGEIRTPDPRIRSPMVYRAELRPRMRTRIGRAQEQFVVVMITVVGDFNKTGCLDWMSNSADYMPIGARRLCAHIGCLRSFETYPGRSQWFDGTTPDQRFDFMYTASE